MRSDRNPRGISYLIRGAFTRSPAARSMRSPEFGQVDWGDLRRLAPLGEEHERGTPVDRAYVADFLTQHAGRIAGHVLSIGALEFAARFPNGHVANAAQLAEMPVDSFDCVVLTPNLRHEFNVRASARDLYRVLRPGGVLLAFLPAIGPTDSDSPAWAFTDLSARKLFGSIFGAANLLTEPRGNLLACTALLHRVAAEEIAPEHLWHVDPRYPVGISLMAVKAANPPIPSQRAHDGSDNVSSGRQPTVSVVMPFLNASRFMSDAVASVLAQSFRDWELLLVDDGTTDASSNYAREVCAAYPDRVHCIEHDGHRNRGISASRNLGARSATGRLIAFLDADDVWLPNRLERQVALLDAHPEAGVLYNVPVYWYGWTGSTEDAARDYVPETGFADGLLMRPPELATRVYPLGSINSPGSGLIVRRELFTRLGGFEESFTGFYEDQPFLAKVYLNANVLISREYLWRYRMHDESCVSETKRQNQYHEIRGQFLDWYQAYVRAQGAPASVQAALAAAIRKHQHNPTADGGGEMSSRTKPSTRSRRRILRNQASADQDVAHWQRLASSYEHRLKDQRHWIFQLRQTTQWLERHVKEWQSIASEREKLLEEQRAWTAKVAEGKQWLEQQWRNQQCLADERQKEIDAVSRRLIALEGPSARDVEIEPEMPRP